MEYFFVTWQEVSDTQYIHSEHVLADVKTVEDYCAANQANSVPATLMVTYRNYLQATERLRAVQVARCADVNKWADGVRRELQKCEDADRVALASRQGAERELKRSRGEEVPEEPETKPTVGDFEVGSSTDGEGAKRRKAILEARNPKGQKDQLPSASVESKERIRKAAVLEKRAQRAAAEWPK